MELDDDHIKDLFSSKFTHFEPEVPDATWSKIEAKLGVASAAPVIPISKNKISKKILRISVAATGIAAMLIALVYLLPQQADNASSITLSKSNIIKSKILLGDFNKHASYRAIATNYESKIEHAKTKSHLGTTQNKSLTKDIQKQNSFLNESWAKDAYTKTTSKTDVEVNSNNTLADHNNTKLQKPSGQAQLNDEIAAKIAAFKEEGDNQKNLLAQNDVQIRHKKGSEKLGIGLNGGSSVSSSDQFNSDYKSPYPDGNPVTALRSTTTRLKHNQPITFGITISKQISSKLSIESGITYAYLSSKLGAGDTNDFRKKDMQYFHYLGIPLTLNYTFAQWNRFIFYSSLGGMVQKDLWGRRTTHTYLGTSDSEYSTKEKISQRNPQFSIHGGLGASYPLYDKLHVYTKIGAAYYIGANNEYETIYSDKKWLFNFNLGLRFEF